MSEKQGEYFQGSKMEAVPLTVPLCHATFKTNNNRPLQNDQKSLVRYLSYLSFKLRNPLSLSKQPSGIPKNPKTEVGGYIDSLSFR